MEGEREGDGRGERGGMGERDRRLLVVPLYSHTSACVSCFVAPSHDKSTYYALLALGTNISYRPMIIGTIKGGYM